MGRGKEMKLNTDKNYNVRFGTVDNKNPRSVYIQISAWGKPKDPLVDDYDNLLRKKSKKIKNELFNSIKEGLFHKEKTIVDFNMASSGISYNKKSYMSVEMTLFKKEPLLPINSNELIKELDEISEKIISNIFEVDDHFKFFKTKN